MNLSKSHLAREAGDERKAWGGAKWNPRDLKKTKGLSPRSGRQLLVIISSSAGAFARFARSVLPFVVILGFRFASLHPRLYAFTRYAGFGKVSPINLIRASLGLSGKKKGEHYCSPFFLGV
jgi:hypothetical protein